MSPARYLRITFWLTLAGVLFSGYLSAVKLATGTCAFNESCPYFLGYPACWYGFVMFLAMFFLVLAARYRGLASRASAQWIAWISTAGILFAGQFVWRELVLWLSSGNPDYGLVFPTCVYGLVFYLAIFILSLVMLKRGSRPELP
ncbi:MAG: hypothetical protein UY96_C0002G0011 [Parcubacteria group bacterium GW2011_GWB1_56_8]|nr:MAG: hypothetical protein UY96_C0002G0011 [Parcubacteria group bacterium GW2011_GWB1_56_8]